MHPSCVVFLQATALLAAQWTLADSCSTVSGPAGEFACVSISRYSGLQYATCLTNTYIKLKSGNRHHCENTYATYCYYQCMIELHDSNSGVVTPDCACDGSIGATPTPFTGTTLPPSCYSPSGEDCNWYTDCLEKKIACGPETGYALAFGKKYCQLYDANYKKLSKLAQQWVDAVRKCLQVSLVPLIRQYYHPTCDEVKKTAISHHTGCYLSPFEGQPSICDVFVNNPKDIWRIFFTIKGAFIEPDLVVTSGTWISFAQVLVACPVKLAVDASIAIYETVIESSLRLLGRRKRSTEAEPGDIAVRFATALADSLGWKALGIEWIPLTGNFTQTGSVTFRLLIGDQREFDLNRNYSQPMDLRAEMQRLKIKVQKGEVHFNLTDGQFSMRQLSECDNLNCTAVKSTTLAEPIKSAEATHGLLVMVNLCALLTIASFCSLI